LLKLATEVKDLDRCLILRGNYNLKIYRLEELKPLFEKKALDENWGWSKVASLTSSKVLQNVECARGKSLKLKYG